MNDKQLVERVQRIIDIADYPGGCFHGGDELELSTLVGDGTRKEVLSAEDFRRARQALALKEKE